MQPHFQWPKISQKSNFYLLSDTSACLHARVLELKWTANSDRFTSGFCFCSFFQVEKIKNQFHSLNFNNIEIKTRMKSTQFVSQWITVKVFSLSNKSREYSWFVFVMWHFICIKFRSHLQQLMQWKTERKCLTVNLLFLYIPMNKNLTQPSKGSRFIWIWV